MLFHHDAPLAQRMPPYVQPARTGYGPKSVEEALKWLGEPTDPRTWEAIHSTGRIVVTPDGRPIRSAITGRRHTVTGSYSSQKTRRTHPHESMIEHAFLQESEVDVDVVDFRSQPFRFEFSLEGRPRIYIADICRVLSSGAVEVVEVKADRKHLRDPEYAAKLAVVGEMCRQIGWRFRTVTKDRLFTPPARRANILLVQSKGKAEFTTRDVYAAIEAIDEAGGEAEFGSVCAVLGGTQIGAARVMAMMVGRILKIDLQRPINPRSRVSLVVGGPAFAEGVR